MKSAFGLLALASALITPILSAQDGTRSRRELEKIATRYLRIDGRVDAGLGQRAELRSQLASAAELTGPAQRSWRKKLERVWKKGDKLEKTKGDHFLWPKERRGRYIVGGKTSRPKGLAICMHGGGVGAGDAAGARGAYDSAISAMSWIGIYPEVLDKTEHGWTDAGTEEFVMELLDRGLRTWKVDPDRIYFVGHSMGGYGSWTLGAHHADRVAALAPSAGAPTPILNAADDSIADIVEGVIPNLRNVPLVIFQSDDDPRVPPVVNRAAVKQLESAQRRWGGYDFHYWEVTGLGHGPPPGGFRAHLEKIADHRRDAAPTKIVWQPTLSWKQQFYWLWWDTPVLNSIVVAERNEKGDRIEITTDASSSGLHVLVPNEVLDAQLEVVVTVNGEEAWRGLPTRDLATLVMTSTHGDASLRYSARIPVGR